MEKLVRDNTELISIFLKNILPNRWNSNKIFVPLLLSFITFIIENRPLFLHYPHSISIRHFSFQRFRYFCFYPRSPFSNACSPFSKRFDEASFIRHAWRTSLVGYFLAVSLRIQKERKKGKKHFTDIIVKKIRWIDACTRSTRDHDRDHGRDGAFPAISFLDFETERK